MATIDSSHSYKGSSGDYTAESQWDTAFVEVDIPSSIDGKTQKAYMYRSKKEMPQPLIISLHTWSGNYTQMDPLANEILNYEWNYIHPDFRGQNWTPDAMCSSLAIADIEDAIHYALANTCTNPQDVHIIGLSGGGFATLAAYMQIEYPVKSFSAWVPISDIEAWYWESVGRKEGYAQDILNAISAKRTLNQEEAIRRSPLKQAFPREKRKNAQLSIYGGIHDGYDGPVPITHSIYMYNRIVGELKYGISETDEILAKAISDPDLVSEKNIINLLTKRINPECSKEGMLLDRNIHFSRQYDNIKLIIFEGEHELLPQALQLIPSL
ncbi:alpha/beta fold hydrolase [Bacteroides sp.]|uniref:alpha/beta hydrolase family protein n=1 Tax=Bacteroides sp. TaxID=29523 RepID=UPI00261EC0D7|nr:alpha/beta fold hydrolase [Bacteroides sp.]